jgi:hypothetical protein
VVRYKKQLFLVPELADQLLVRVDPHREALQPERMGQRPRPMELLAQQVRFSSMKSHGEVAKPSCWQPVAYFSRL